MIKKLNRRIVLAVIAVMLLAVGAGYALWQDNQPDLAETEQTAETNQPNGGRITEDQVEQDDTDPPPSPPEPNDPNDKVIVAPSPTDDDSTANGSGNIAAPQISRAEQSGNDIRVAASFDTATSGSCELRLERRGAKTVTKTVEIIVGSSYYACNGFRVPVSELSASGEWSARVIHKLNGRSASSSTKKFVVTR